MVPNTILFTAIFETPFHSEESNPQMLAVIIAPAVKMTQPIVVPASPKAEAAQP